MAHVLRLLGREDLARSSQGIRFEGATFAETLFGETAALLEEKFDSPSPDAEVGFDHFPGFIFVPPVLIRRGEPKSETDRDYRALVETRMGTLLVVGRQIAEVALTTVIALCVPGKLIHNWDEGKCPLVIALRRGSENEVQILQAPKLSESHLSKLQLIPRQQIFSAVSNPDLQSIFVIQLPGR